MKINIGKINGEISILHNGTSLILPSGICMFCQGYLSPRFGYGDCPICRGANSQALQKIDDLMEEKEELENQVEDLAGKIEALTEKIADLRREAKCQ